MTRAQETTFIKGSAIFVAILTCLCILGIGLVGGYKMGGGKPCNGIKNSSAIEDTAGFPDRFITTDDKYYPHIDTVRWTYSITDSKGDTIYSQGPIQ